MSVALIRRRFSIDDYERMCRHGILTEDDRVELIRGEIVEKTNIGERHAACVNRLTRLLTVAVGERAQVSVQNPVRLLDSEPEPDLALLRPRDDFYASVRPGAGDLLLVVEVADSTLDADRQIKGPLYAEAGVAEFWLVNLIDDTLELRRGPCIDGVYSESRTLRRGDTVEIAALPGIVLNVAEMF